VLPFFSGCALRHFHDIQYWLSGDFKQVVLANVAIEKPFINETFGSFFHHSFYAIYLPYYFITWIVNWDNLFDRNLKGIPCALEMWLVFSQYHASVGMAIMRLWILLMVHQKTQKIVELDVTGVEDSPEKQKVLKHINRYFSTELLLKSLLANFALTTLVIIISWIDYPNEWNIWREDGQLLQWLLRPNRVPELRLVNHGRCRVPRSIRQGLLNACWTN
jgi:hypothetical protein